MHKLRPEAEELRKQGYSYKLIETKLGISRSTMSYWFKDQPFTPNKEVIERMKAGPSKVGIQRHNARVNEIKKLRDRGVSEVGSLSERDLWLLGLGIYIGEGSKSTEIISISNANPAVIRLAVKWFVDACGLKPENLTIRLHLYPDNDEQQSINYWQKITGLPENSFRKSVIDIRTNKQAVKRRKLTHGTVDLRVISKGDPEKGRRLFRRISGWMTGALNQV